MTQRTNPPRTAATTRVDKTLESSDNPAVIEKDIRRTQDSISETIDELTDQLNPKAMVKSFFASSDDGEPSPIVESAKRNPLALALIAGGIGWLVSDKDAHPDEFTSDDDNDSRDLATYRRRGYGRRSLRNRVRNRFGSTSADYDNTHAGYVAHMSSFDHRDGEDDKSYNRRRDMHRANYFMLEREDDEDDKSFKQRLDEATKSLREKTRTFGENVSAKGRDLRDGTSDRMSSAGDSLSDAGSYVGERSRYYGGRTQDLYDDNPLVGGLIAAAVGAAIGTVAPMSRIEDEELGDLGQEARDRASEKAHEAVEKGREKKDELVSKAREKKDEAKQKADRNMKSGKA